MTTVVVAPNAKVPKLTGSVLKDPNQSSLYVRQMEDIFVTYKIADGIKTTGGDADDAEKAASVAGYIWQSVVQGDVDSFQLLFKLKKYASRGDLMWSKLKPVLTEKRKDDNDKDEWRRCDEYLKEPKFSKETMGLLSIWEIHLEATLEKATELANGVDGRTAPASEEVVIQSILMQKGCLPAWADGDTFIRSSIATKNTFSTFIAALELAYKSVPPAQDDEVSAVGVGGKYSASDEVCRAFQAHGKCRFRDKCRYKHVQGSGPKPTSGAKKTATVCYKFRDTGKCKFGDGCKFQHGAQGSASGETKKTWKSNPIVNGEPSKCEHCGSLFHLKAKCDKPGEHRIAAIEEGHRETQQSLMDICREMQTRVNKLEQTGAGVAAVMPSAGDDRSAESAMAKFIESYESVAAVGSVAGKQTE